MGYYAYNDLTGLFDTWISTAGETPPLTGETQTDYYARIALYNDGGTTTTPGITTVPFITPTEVAQPSQQLTNGGSSGLSSLLWVGGIAAVLGMVSKRRQVHKVAASRRLVRRAARSKAHKKKRK